MTSHAPAAATSRRGRRRGHARRRRLITVVIAASAVLVGGSTATYALWSSSTDFAAASLTAGDLQVTQGEGTWRQTTPGITAPASGTLSAGPGSFVSMPGDVIEVRVPIRTTVVGENLRAQLTVTGGVALTAELESGSVTAGYHLESIDDPGATVSDVALGSPVSVDGLDGADGGAVRDWNVVVTVRIGGAYRWETSPQVGSAAWTLDDLSVDLAQIRTGDTGGEGAP